VSGVRRHTVTVVALVLLAFAVAHSLEDFSYGVPHERFGIDTSPAAALLAAGFVVQVLVLAAARSGHPLAYLANAGVGLAWFLAAALDHLGEVLGSELYRAGLFSKTLEVGIMVSGLALFILAGMAAYAAARRGHTQDGEREP
jgi:hypothetical protein